MNPAPPLIGTYTPPRVRRGDRVHCLYRGAECVVTTMHDGRIPWPRCRALHSRGRPSLLVTEELVRAIRTESAIALKHWFGVGTKGVWRWRVAFGASGVLGTPGSRAAHLEHSRAGAGVVKERGLTDEQCDARSATAKRQGQRVPPRWTPERGGWTPAEVKLLRGKMSDKEVAVRTGRTENAVRFKRRRIQQAP